MTDALPIIRALLRHALPSPDRDQPAPSLPGGDAGWTEIIRVANHCMVTPALFTGLANAGLLDRVPEDARAYLHLIHDRNGARSARLRRQLLGVLGALNRAGVRPLLLKGTAGLITAQGLAPADRFTTDLDLLIPPGATAASVAALRAAGYEAVAKRPGDRPTAPHTVAEFVAAHADAPADAQVDLHRAALDLAHLLPAERLFADACPIAVDGRAALVASPWHAVLVRVLHDQIQDGEHHRGRTNLRRLFDLAALLQQLGGGDPGEHRHRLRRLGAWGAVTTQIAMAGSLFGVPLPPLTRGERHGARLQHLRRRLQQDSPLARAVGEALGRAGWAFARCRYATGGTGLREELAILRGRSAHLLHLAGKLAHAGTLRGG